MSKIIGLPVIKLINKDTGKTIREISVKNTTTSQFEFMISPVNLYYLLKNSNASRSHTASNFGSYPINAIYTLPFIKSKSRRFSGGSLESISFANVYDINGEKAISFARRVGSETGISSKQDDTGKLIVSFHGAIEAPSATRSIGTVGLTFPSSSYANTLGFSGDTFPVAFTPLEEVIVQDSTMIVDITYNLIIDGSNENNSEYGAVVDAIQALTNSNFDSFYTKNSVSKPSFASNTNPNKGAISSCISYDDNTSDKYKGYCIQTDVKTASVSVAENNNMNSLSPSIKYDISFESMNKCGDLIGSLSFVPPSNKLLSYGGDTRKTIKNFKSGRSKFTVYEKSKDGNKNTAPFLDIQNFKKGTGSITATGSKQKWLPERWEVEVTSDGPAGVAKFKVRKNYATSYAGNTNGQIARSVPHLSPNTAGSVASTQFNHKYGEDLTFKSSMFKLWDFNIVLVSRKAAAITLATNNKYIVFDETNLIPNSGTISLNGLAWDNNTKELVLSCQNNGLYKITSLDMNTDQTPVVTKITGVGKIYSISTDGFGGIGILTEDSLKFSKNLGSTWISIPNSEIFKSTGLESESVEKISLMVTDFESPDYKTLFVMNHDAGSNKDVWLSTTEKAGTRVNLTSSNNNVLMRIASYCINDDRLRSLASLYNSLHINSYKRYVLIGLNIMPQSLAYVSDGKFYLNGTEVLTEANGAQVEYTGYDYKSSSRSIGAISKWGNSTSQMINMIGSVGVKSGSRFSCINSSNQNVLNERNTDGSYTDQKNTALDIMMYRGSETSLGLFVPSRDAYTMLIGSGGEDYSIFRVYTSNDIVMLQNINPTIDNIPFIKTRYETFILGSVSFENIDNSFYIKYAKRPDGQFVEYIDTTSDSEEYTLSGDTVIDGVTIGVSPSGEFKTGDVYGFIRYDGIVKDNLTTGLIKAEISPFDLSEEIVHEGTVSVEGPRSLVKFNCIDHFDGRVTRDGYIKSEGEGAGFASSLSQSVIYGDFKMPLSIENLNGVFAIELSIAPIDNSYGYDYNSNGYIAKLIIGNINNEPFYTLTGSSSNNRNLYTIPAATIKTNTLKNKSDLHILYDGKTRVFKLMAGTAELARTSSHSQDLAPIISVYIYALNTSINANSSINISFMPRVELTNSGGVMNRGQSVFKIPTFQESNKDVLCTILGNQERSTGYYDPKFIAIGGIPGDSIKVTIGGNPATILMNNALSNVKNNSHEGYKTYLLPKTRSISAGYDSSLTQGQVYVDQVSGIVLFSNDDRGKRYSIRYRYYKDNKFGIDEVTNE